ncbi:redoxin domain-containing protein [Sphingomicrobium astaxanthinifaciens]|uniref:redoxin domain-containing protein n=1 Tax=Sphingomicrobium astaxanthinifaciens TaxID=1227949 RepID=UPI001FCBD0DC|nr:redoxin domain-containing protein [Sphingomicrobium astaxanthinifaciens]MCJ7420672.1 redoxin domain-containing protein [Sphingomicrobium astaxanthinifaciens]
MTQLIPNRKVPALDLPLVREGRFSIHEARPEYLTGIGFYRGLHCPICKDWLEQLDGLVEDYGALGVSVVAVSMDEPARARKTRMDWDIGRVPIAHDMSEETARAWGLYISTRREGSEEPERFSEPGLFLVRPDGTLFGCSVQSMPFTRPDWNDLLGGLKFIKEKDYPARGAAT